MPLRVGSRPASTVDDTAGLWASPTHGHPVPLAYLPLGTELIAVFRPADILAHPEGKKAADLLGVDLRDRLSEWSKMVGIPWQRIERLTVGLPSAEGPSQGPTCVIVMNSPLDAWKQQLLDAGARAVEHRGGPYLTINRTAFYLPAGAAVPTVVVCPAEALSTVMDAGQVPPPLRRSVEQLVPFTDADRLVTVLFPPTYLSAALAPLCGDAWPQMKQSLDWLLGHDIHAVHLSAHVDEHLFVEVQLAGALQMSYPKWAAAAPDRLENTLEQLTRRYASVDRDSYGYELLKRAPDMASAVSTHTRVLDLPDCVVMRCYLPSVAAHNLVALAMLSLHGRSMNP